MGARKGSFKSARRRSRAGVRLDSAARLADTRWRGVAGLVMSPVTVLRTRPLQ